MVFFYWFGFEALLKAGAVVLQENVVGNDMATPSVPLLLKVSFVSGGSSFVT